jgi:hypothetical protein
MKNYPLHIFVVLASLLGRGETPDSLGGQIVAELAQAHAATTPAVWLKTHPEEKLELSNGSAPENDTFKWCARSMVTRSTEGRSWTRVVYFYDPQPPADDALPPVGASAQEALQTTCQLGLMWIEIPETDNAAGAGLTQTIENALEEHYGASEPPETYAAAIGSFNRAAQADSQSASAAPATSKSFDVLTGFGSAYWTNVQQWHLGEAVLTAAYDLQGKGKRALVRLAFSNSDAFHDIKQEMHDRLDLLAWKDDLVRRISQAGSSAGATAGMKALIEGPDYFSGKNKPTGEQVISAIGDWLNQAKSQSAGQQAIALIVADRVLDFLDHNGTGPDEATRAQLKSLGAEYVNNELAGGPVYAHTLLKQAKAIAPPGPPSDEILLYEMERGFDETGMCSSGAEEFKQVIEKGESLLAGARSLPASTLASLHFMVGDAYSTIVWLAMSGEDEYHDPKEYQPMEASARESALGHYRAAFELEHGTPRAQKEWKEAWRLAVGLSPTTEKYFCVYD